MQWLKQSTNVTVQMGPFTDEDDGKTDETELSIAQADIRLSRNGGAFAQTNNGAGASHDENGHYRVPLVTTDTNILGRLRVAIHEAGALPVWRDFLVVPTNTYDSVVSGSDNLDVNVEEINNETTPVFALRDWLEKGIRLTADSGTTTTLTDAGLSQADDYWNGSLLIFRTGTNSGRTAIVTDFDAASNTITFTPAVPDAVTTEGFALVPGLGRADIAAIIGDAAAAAGLKAGWDGSTGVIGPTYPATQAQVGSSVVEYPDAGRMMAGVNEAGDYTKLAVNDNDYWECTDPDNSNPLEMCVYVNAGSGTFPDAVVIDARYNAQNNRRVHVFAANVDDVAAISDAAATATDDIPSVLTHSVAGSFAGLTLIGYDIYITAGTNATPDFYTIASHTDDAITLDRNCSSGGAVSSIDFIVLVWDQISNDTNAILHKTGADGDYEYPLGVSYMTTDNNEVFLRFSDEGQGSFKTTYDLRLDQVGVITKSLASGGVSAETYAAAVHNELDDHFRHIPSFTGEVSYVSSAGADANSGHDPASPLLTIGAAVTLATAGDYIKVFAAEFAEAVVLNKDGLELHGEIGARITGNAGVPLTISADYCRVDELILTPTAGQVALVVSGDYNKIQIMRTIGGTIAVQNTGTGNEITLVAATEYTATGFDLQGPGGRVCNCLAVSSQASTRGYYLSNTAADRTVVKHSESVNNDTAGFHVVSGVTNAMFVKCTESSTCGTRVDAGTNTDWRDHSRTDHQTDITAILADTGELQTNQGAWATATGFSTHSAANVVTALGTGSTLTDCLTATGFSTHNAAAVKTALETNGSKLDHLWEMTEDDGGTRRLTTNALEQAPGSSAPQLLLETTIDVVTDQTHFTLIAGSDVDGTYEKQSVVLYDDSNNDFPSIRKAATYTGATKGVILNEAPDFTILAGDGIKIFVTVPDTTAPTVNENVAGIMKADAATYEDSAAVDSITGVILQQKHSTLKEVPGKLTIKKVDDSTTFDTLTLETDPGAYLINKVTR